MKKILLLSLLYTITILTIANGADLKPMPEKKLMPDVFYIFKDVGSRENHGIPSGFMGSWKSIKWNSNWRENPKEGISCVKITYDISKDTETSWAGVYVQSTSNNWATSKFGWDLSPYKKFTFWARGSGYVEKFGIGGITGATELGDSGEAFIGPIDLTPEWVKYTIDLKDIDLTHIIGLFYWATPAEYNSKNVEIYLDNLAYEK